MRDAAARLDRSVWLLGDDEDPYSQLCSALSALLRSLAADEDVGAGTLDTAEYGLAVAEVVRSWSGE